MAQDKQRTKHSKNTKDIRLKCLYFLSGPIYKTLSEYYIYWKIWLLIENSFDVNFHCYYDVFPINVDTFLFQTSDLDTFFCKQEWERRLEEELDKPRRDSASQIDDFFEPVGPQRGVQQSMSYVSMRTLPGTDDDVFLRYYNLTPCRKATIINKNVLGVKWILFGKIQLNGEALRLCLMPHCFGLETKCLFLEKFLRLVYFCVILHTYIQFLFANFPHFFCLKVTQF